MNLVASKRFKDRIIINTKAEGDLTTKSVRGAGMDVDIIQL
jgi:hypothetical protein